jgi:hypothetical protein
MSANTVMTLAAVVNAIVVIVLARINYRYMLSASDQAKAAVKQADAADKQAAAALENIKLLKAQINDQARLKLTETIIDLRHMSFYVERLISICEDRWGPMKEYKAILPDHWSRIVDVAEQNASHLAENLRTVETQVRNADALINDQVKKEAPYRDPQVFKVVASDLMSASAGIRQVLSELDKKRSSY